MFKVSLLLNWAKPHAKDSGLTGTGAWSSFRPHYCYQMRKSALVRERKAAGHVIRCTKHYSPTHFLLLSDDNRHCCHRLLFETV